MVKMSEAVARGKGAGTGETFEMRLSFLAHFGIP